MTSPRSQISWVVRTRYQTQVVWFLTSILHCILCYFTWIIILPTILFLKLWLGYWWLVDHYMILGGTQAEPYSQQMYCDWLSPQNTYLTVVTYLICIKLYPLQSARKEISLRTQQHVRYFVRLSDSI